MIVIMVQNTNYAYRLKYLDNPTFDKRKVLTFLIYTFFFSGL